MHSKDSPTTEHGQQTMVNLINMTGHILSYDPRGEAITQVHDEQIDTKENEVFMAVNTTMNDSMQKTLLTNNRLIPQKCQMTP